MAAINVVKQCLNLAPVPCLGAAFQLFQSIWDVVQLVGSYKFQLQELTRSIALLLSTLNDQYQRQEPLEASTWDALSNLGRCGRLILAIFDWLTVFVNGQSIDGYLGPSQKAEELWILQVAFHQR